MSMEERLLKIKKTMNDAKEQSQMLKGSKQTILAQVETDFKCKETDIETELSKLKTEVENKKEKLECKISEKEDFIRSKTNGF